MDIFGYFDSAGQKTPTYDPGRTALCPFCLREIAHGPIKTISLLLDGDNRSYFYRAHKGCWENADHKNRDQIEHSLIDARAKVTP